MAKLYYGSGNVSIEGTNIVCIIIKYRGAIIVDDKTSTSFAITHQGNSITVFQLGEGVLNELFDYQGEFKIISVSVANSSAEIVPTTIHKVMDYAELLNTNAEDMTTNSEDLKATHVSGKKVSKTTLRQPYIPNRHTSRHNGELYLKDGTLYEGDFHIHLNNGSTMTGGEHTISSQDLYFKDGRPTRNPSSIPYGVIEQKKARKIQQVKNKRLKNKRTKRNGGGY
tara:strand:+ start:713 stop:1387 length:675 start_codon:yes stop_codon:yes gene_type:complete